MRRSEVIDRLKQAEPAIRELGASALYLFGSYARDEATTDSDIDVFIDKDRLATSACTSSWVFISSYRKRSDGTWIIRRAKFP